ncbi:MAG: DUF3310 domain-containing protein [Betaproteobacteria bacterium]|nr:DUF3310 domain-containing protein [Betaproteobacteria bacterium]
MNDEVHNPKHYTSHGSGVECIELVENLQFCVGNAVKYLWRKDLKGKHDQDKDKSIWYLQREIQRVNNHQIVVRRFHDYVKKHPGDVAAAIILKIATAPWMPHTEDEYHEAIETIRTRL